MNKDVEFNTLPRIFNVPAEIVILEDDPRAIVPWILFIPEILRITPALAIPDPSATMLFAIVMPFKISRAAPANIVV